MGYSEATGCPLCLTVNVECTAQEHEASDILVLVVTYQNKAVSVN